MQASIRQEHLQVVAPELLVEFVLVQRSSTVLGRRIRTKFRGALGEFVKLPALSSDSNGLLFLRLRSLSGQKSLLALVKAGACTNRQPLLVPVQWAQGSRQEQVLPVQVQVQVDMQEASSAAHSGMDFMVTACTDKSKAMSVATSEVARGIVGKDEALTVVPMPPARRSWLSGLVGHRRQRSTSSSAASITSNSHITSALDGSANTSLTLQPAAGHSILDVDTTSLPALPEAPALASPTGAVLCGGGRWQPQYLRRQPSLQLQQASGAGTTMAGSNHEVPTEAAAAQISGESSGTSIGSSTSAVLMGSSSHSMKKARVGSILARLFSTKRNGISPTAWDDSDGPSCSSLGCADAEPASENSSSAQTTLELACTTSASSSPASRLHSMEGGALDAEQLQLLFVDTAAPVTGNNACSPSTAGPAAGLVLLPQESVPAAPATSQMSSAVTSMSHPLHQELERVLAWVQQQPEMDEAVLIELVSQVRTLQDCLAGEDAWIVHDSLQQLKRQFGYPFDLGLPMAGAFSSTSNAWYRLTLQQPEGASEHLNVQYAGFDQISAGGEHACSAIALAAAEPCLRALRRQGCSSRNGSHRRSCLMAGGGSSSRRRSTASCSTFARGVSAAYSILNGEVLEECIQAGTMIWQRVMADPTTAHLRTACGDFDVTCMMQQGGECFGALCEASYSAVSLAAGNGCPVSLSGRRSNTGCSLSSKPAPLPASIACGSGDVLNCHGSMDSEHDAAEDARHSSTTGDLQRQLPFARSSAPLLSSCHSQGLQSSSHSLHSASCSLQSPNTSSPTPQLVSSPLRRSSDSGTLPRFGPFMHSLAAGVYILNCHGHVNTLCVCHDGSMLLIDSLGASLAPNCPLGFLVAFDSCLDLVDFFRARHQHRCDSGVEAAGQNVSEATKAALLEVHEMQLVI